nr:cupin domain-containing protein [uncultured Rhodopila sp.]
MNPSMLRRDAMLAALAAAFADSAAASPLNPGQTIIRPPDALQWKPNPAFPEPCVEYCVLAGNLDQPGLYYTLVRWWPGFMSAPHHYATDRLCVVVSGTWWCNSGADFDPAACVPVSAGSFVRRVAGTPHYDGVIRGHPEPAVIAICGMGPVHYELADPSLPGVRRV